MSKASNTAKRCDSRCPNEPTPQGMELEVVATHPRYRHLLEPGAQCCLEDGHEGPHRVAQGSGIVWHSPPLIVHEARA